MHTSVFVMRMHLTDTLLDLCHSSLTDLSSSRPSLSAIRFASLSICRAAASRSCLISYTSAASHDSAPSKAMLGTKQSGAALARPS